MKKDKILKGTLTVITCASLAPINSINTKADEINENDNITYDLPSVNKKYIITFEGIDSVIELLPGDTIPNPDYVGEVPEGKEFKGWVNDNYSVGSILPEITTGQHINILFTPTFSDKVVEPPVEPEPTPPVITEKYITNVTSNNFIINQNEINIVDIKELGNIVVDQTKEIYHDGILNSTIKTNPKLTFNNKLINQLGTQVINYSVENSDEVYSLTINVVANDNYISQDRSLTMSVDYPNVEITQEEAQQMVTANHFINLNGVKGFNVLGQQEKIGLVQSENVNLIASGKPGTYIVEYGTLNQQTKNKFIAEAQITVIASEKPVEELPSTSVEGVVNKNQIKDQIGNEIKNTSVNKTDTAMKTGISTNLLLLVPATILSFIFLVKNNKRKK